MVKIEINNWTAKLSGDKAVLEILYDELKFKHPNAYYIQQRIKRNWDGFIYPLSSSGVISVGLLQRVEDILAEMEVEVEVTDYRHIPEFLGLVTQLGPLTLRGYQEGVVLSVLQNRVMGVPHPRGIVAVGVGGGKTVMMFAIHASYNYPKTLIIVNNSPLYGQILKDLSVTFPDSHGYLRGQTFRDGRIILTMAQTAVKHLKTKKGLFSSIRAILVDEADDQVNDTLKKIIKACPGAPIRVGFTGTSFVRDLKKDRLRNHELEATFGAQLCFIGTEDLAKEGVTTKTQVKLVKGPGVALFTLGYMDEVTKLTSSKVALEKILQRVKYNMRQGRNYIMIYNRFIPVAEKVFEFLQRRLPDVSIGLLDHKRFKANPQVLEDFRDGRINILVNTLFLKRGLNLPKVRVIINNACGDYPSTALQVLGRGVRLDEGKEVFYFEDLMYNGEYVKSHNNSRIKAYKKFGYEILDLRE